MRVKGCGPSTRKPEEWAYFDGRQNHLRDVAGLGRLIKIRCPTIMTRRHVHT